MTGVALNFKSQQALTSQSKPFLVKYGRKLRIQVKFNQVIFYK